MAAATAPPLTSSVDGGNEDAVPVTAATDEPALVAEATGVDAATVAQVTENTVPGGAEVAGAAGEPVLVAEAAKVDAATVTEVTENTVPGGAEATEVEIVPMTGAAVEPIPGGAGRSSRRGNRPSGGGGVGF